MKRRNTCNKEIVEETAREYGVSEELVKDITNAQSKFTREVVESNSFDGVRWLYLGKVSAKLKKVQYRNEYKGRRNKQQEI